MNYKSILSLLSLISLTINIYTQSGYDCFSILIGRNASADGSVMLAHNEDDWGERVVNFLKVPANDSALAVVQKGNLLQLEGPLNEFVWLEMPEMEFSDAYMNQWGVTIASDACVSREDQPTLVKEGIGYWLRRTMALKAKSARDAVKIGGALIDKYGYASSGRTYVIADPEEAWMFSAVYGKHWVAQRIPDDEVAIIPNYYTISHVNLSDTNNFYGSADLITYAIERGWYDPSIDGAFSFRDAYSEQGNLTSNENIYRHWNAINILGAENYTLEGPFPFSFKPKDKIKLEDIFSVLRSHYEGTALDASNNYLMGDPHLTHRGICAVSTQYGFVAQLRKDLPVELGNVLWLSIFRPCTHVFIPVYYGINEFPEDFSKDNPENILKMHFNKIESIESYADGLVYYDFYKHANSIDENYGDMIPAIQYDNYMLETDCLESRPQYESEMILLLKQDREKAISRITEDVFRMFSSYRTKIKM